jgi:hypothetical protein
MEDQQQQIIKNKRKWLKWLIGVLLFLLLVFILVFPPVFSRLILRPTIEQGFSQATSNQYQIEFKQLKWSLLGRKIEIIDLRVNPSAELKDTSHFFQFELDRLSLDKIHYMDLLDGNVRLKSAILEGVMLENSSSLSDSIQVQQQIDIPFLNSLIVDDIQINIKSIFLFKRLDSIVFLQGGQIQMEQLQWDSVSYADRVNWPIIKRLSASFQKMDYQQQHKRLRFNNFKISEKRLTEFQMLFEKINYVDQETNQSITLNWPSLELDSLRRNDVNGKWLFDINTLTFQTDSILNYQPVPAGKKPAEIRNSIMQLVGDLGIEIKIDSILLKTRFNEWKNNSFLSQLKNLDAKISGFNLSNKLFDLHSFSIDGNEQIWVLNKSGDSIGFHKIHMSDDDCSLHHIRISPKNGQYKFETSLLEINSLDVPHLLFNEKLIANSIILSQPYFELKKQRELNDPSIKSPFQIEIDNLQIEEGDVRLIPYKLLIRSMDLRLSKLLLLKGKRIYLDSLFSEFDFKASQLQYSDVVHPFDLDVNGLKINSENGLFHLQRLKIEELDTYIPTQVELSNLAISGFDWRKIYRNPGQMEFVDFSSDSVKMEGDLSSIGLENRGDSGREISLYIQNIDLPDVELDLHMEKAGAGRKVYLEKLHLLSNSFKYQSSADKPITVADLVLQSSFSSFSENQDSLLFTASAWNFNSKNERWESEQIFIQQLYQNDSIRAKSDTKIKIPKLVISGLNPYDYLVNKKIEIDSLVVLNPEISFNGQRMTRMPKVETQNWHEELRKIIEQFVYIDFNYVQLEKADLLFKNNYLGRRDQLSVEDVDLFIKDFYLDYQSLQNWNRFAFSNEFKLDFKNYFFNIKNGQYLFDIQKGVIQSEDRSLKMSNISLLSLNDTLNLPVNFQIHQLTIKDFYLNATSDLPSLNVGLFLLDRPGLQLKQTTTIKQNDKTNTLESINLYNSFKDYLSAVILDTFSIQQLDFDYLSAENDYDLKNIDISANGIKIDSDNHIFTDKKFFYSNNLELVLPQFGFVSANRFYQYQMQNIRFISSTNKLMLDSLKITSRYDRKTFSANLKYQKDQIDALIPHIELANIDFRDAVFRERYKADKIDIYQPSIWIYKDKTIVVDTAAYKPMPAQLLSDLKFYVNIDTAQVYNGFLQYEEFNNLMEVPGKVFFTDLNSRITGMSNDKDLIEFGGAIKILASGKIMAKSNLSLTAVFPLNSTKQDFVMLAAMDQLNAKELNPLIQPLTLLSAKEGNLMQMQMNVRGNNHFAYGEMLLKYENLRVEVLNKKLKESGLATFLANSLLIRKNNKNFLFPRKGPIYFDRIDYRSFIHYMIHFAIVGTKTSLGVDKRKTQRKADEVRVLE